MSLSGRAFIPTQHSVQGNTMRVIFFPDICCPARVPTIYELDGQYSWRYLVK